MDTANVLERAATGDDGAWAELVSTYGQMLRGVARQMRVRDCDAEDAAQLTWLALQDDVGTLRDPDRLGAWLRTVMRRRCLAVIGVLRRERLADDTESWAQPDPPVDSGRDGVGATLWHFVDELPVREQAVLRALFDGTDRPYREIAIELDMPVGAIGPVRMRALRRLGCRITAAGITAGDLIGAC